MSEYAKIWGTMSAAVSEYASQQSFECPCCESDSTIFIRGKVASNLDIKLRVACRDCSKRSWIILGRIVNNRDAQDSDGTSRVLTAISLCHKEIMTGQSAMRDEFATVIPRKHPSTETKQIHKAVCAERFTGKCPCCLNDAVLDSQGVPIPDAYQIDHFYSRAQAALHQTWPVCVNCNRRLRDSSEFKNRSRVRFDSYQVAVLECRSDCDKQKDLF